MTQAILIDAKGFEKTVELTEEETRSDYYRFIWHRPKKDHLAKRYDPNHITEAATVVATDFQLIGRFQSKKGTVLVFEEVGS